MNRLTPLLSKATRILAAALYGVSVLLGSASAVADDFAPDTVLVSFQPGATGAAVSEAHRQVGGTVRNTLSGINVEVVTVPEGTVLSAIQKYESNPNVIYAEPSYHRYLFKPESTEGSVGTPSIPNMFTEQWWLENTGQDFGATVDPFYGTLIYPAYKGIADADIDAPDAWLINSGSSGVTIAIIDSGVSCLHADLQNKCVEQQNFVSGIEANPGDLIGHGTHVAALAAANYDNGVGIAGVAPGVSIASLKVCYADPFYYDLGFLVGVCDDAAIAEAIQHAADQQYQVISMSLAGPAGSTTLRNAVDYAWAAGSVIVAGAGNDYLTDKRYPAAYDNVIAVAATDQYDNLAYFSSFSTDADDWVSVAAPGVSMLSAVPGSFCGIDEADPEGCYDWKSGTSMSTPVVSGVAALLWSHLGSTTNAEVRNLLESTADTTGVLGQNLLSWTAHGRVNLLSALSAQPGGEPPPPPDPPPGDEDTTAPEISNVQSSSAGGTRFSISWDTNELATTVVKITGSGVFSDEALVSSHIKTFRGSKHVTYEYYVSSADAAGNSTGFVGPYYHNN